MDFHLLSNLVSVEMDVVTGWVKATRSSGEVFLIQPRDLLTLMTWSQGNTHTLLASQHTIDQEAVLYSSSSVQNHARRVRLLTSFSIQEGKNTTTAIPQKRRRRKLLPFPSLQISEALPCVLECPNRTMTALLDFAASSHDPWLLYPLCEEHLRTVLAKREATGLSLRVIVEQFTEPAP